MCNMRKAIGCYCNYLSFTPYYGRVIYYQIQTFAVADKDFIIYVGIENLILIYVIKFLLY